ncbi:hypothetical protein [Sphingobium sp.]|uniref:hypothetical protein n=1 Tax=Sphingobium sp. TaxID=1912891 RepID=UPI0035C7626A
MPVAMRFAPWREGVPALGHESMTGTLWSAHKHWLLPSHFFWKNIAQSFQRNCHKCRRATLFYREGVLKEIMP